MARGPRRPPFALRVLRARLRLFASAAVGLAAGLAFGAASGSRFVTSSLTGWDLGVALYLGLALHAVARSDVARIRRRAAEEDEGDLAILVLTVAAALVSLAAIFVELGTAAGPGMARSPGRVALAILTIALSWTLIHVIFALHYAHEFYDEERGGGMSFPGGDAEPDYWDFVYFSFVVGMTSQVSDVGVTSKRVRRTVTAHGIVSFVFNAALVALTVNIAAGAVQGGGAGAAALLHDRPA
jgi:uncharacterized membrane protein